MNYMNSKIILSNLSIKKSLMNWFRASKKMGFLFRGLPESDLRVAMRSLQDTTG